MNRMTINGVSLETDKNAVSVNGNVFRFGDGSIYDSRTGEFKNAGPGYVRVNGKLLSDNSPSDNQPEEVVTKSHNFLELTELSLALGIADCVVKHYDEPGIYVDLCGPAKMIESIELTQHKSRLHISDMDLGGAGGNSVIIGSFISTSSFGDIQIDGSPSSAMQRDKVTINVFVPIGTTVYASSSTSAEILIKGVGGPVGLSASTSGRIDVEGANGAIDVTASTSGKVTIDGGSIDKLKASVSTSGKVNVNSTAQKAELSASTSGRINVDRVVQMPWINESTSGRVRVAQIG